MPEKAAPTGGSSRRTLRRTYYDILGVPMGASIDQIKDSCRLLTRKTLMTDIAYRTLTDPEKRRETGRHRSLPPTAATFRFAGPRLCAS